MLIMSPKVPQSSRPESSGFPSYPPPLGHRGTLKKPIIEILQGFTSLTLILVDKQADGNLTKLVIFRGVGRLGDRGDTWNIPGTWGDLDRP